MSLSRSGWLTLQVTSHKADGLGFILGPLIIKLTPLGSITQYKGMHTSLREISGLSHLLHGGSLVHGLGKTC